MPVSFLTDEQRASFGRFVGEPSADDLARCFHLDDVDQFLLQRRRGEALRLGFAIQLGTVRFLGTFLDDCLDVPEIVVKMLARQLAITEIGSLPTYAASRQRAEHAREIQEYFGYRDFTAPEVGLRFSRWLYALCWTGTERPGALFERATAWLLEHKVLLPGVTVLERFVAKLRQRVEVRLWRLLCHGVTATQRARLESLLAVPATGGRSSLLDQLRSGPTVVSGPSLVRSLLRLERVRDFDVKLPPAAGIPSSRLASLARYANSAKASAVARLPPLRRLATLVAFVHTLEATAQDDAFEVLEQLLQELFSDARKADQKSRLRSLKDLDASATVLAEACSFVLDEQLPSRSLRSTVFNHVDPDELALAMAEVLSLVRPADDVFYRELLTRYKRVRRYLPMVLKHLRLSASTGGREVMRAVAYLQAKEASARSPLLPPLSVVTPAWQKHVLPDGLQVVMAWHFMLLAAFLLQADPHAAVLHIHVLAAHLERRADAREAVDHQPDQSAVAQAERRAGVDGIQQRPRFLGGQDRRLAFLD